VPEDSVERIVRTIRRAPSGGFSQGQSLVVVTDADLRGRIAEAFDEQGSYVASGGAPFISTAPLHIVVCANESKYHERYNEPDKLNATGGVEITWPVPYWFVDAGALMMLILLAAIDEGLAAAFIGDPEALDRRPARSFSAEAYEGLDRLRLALEDRLHRPVGPISHPAGDPARLGRPRDGEPEADALHPPVDDDSAPDHARRLREVEI